MEKRKNDGFGVTLMLTCATCLCTGQFVWKYYEGELSLAVGFGIYGLGALAMLSVYRFGSLSVLQPVNSVSYAIAVVLGSVFFHEVVTVGKALGIALGILGVFFFLATELALYDSKCVFHLAAHRGLAAHNISFPINCFVRYMRKFA